MVAYRPGAATSIEVTGQSGQPRLHQSENISFNIVPAGLRPPNRTTRVHVGPAVTLRYDRARSSMARNGRRSRPWEPARATAAGGPERTRMAGVYQALDRDSRVAGSLTCVHEGP